MKRFTIFLAGAAAVLSLAMLASCASASKSEDAADSSPKNEASSDDAFTKVYTQAREKLAEGGEQTYTVQSGDTLTAITKQFYGDDKGYYFPMIMAASSDVVTNPDLIVPGMELTIPDYDANMEDSKVRSALKGVFKKVASIYAKQGKDDMKEHLLSVADSL